MKILVISDLHGSYYYAKKAIEEFQKGNYDHLLLLGDLLNHGPRNPLPQEYAPDQVAQLLNEYADRIFAVRGNCDSEVDQMLLSFPLLTDYLVIPFKERKIFVSHGHLFHPEHLPPLREGDGFLFGHVHILYHQQVNGIHLLNPGSISLPKMDLPHTYGVLTEEDFTIYTVDGQEFASHTF